MNEAQPRYSLPPETPAKAEGTFSKLAKINTSAVDFFSRTNASLCTARPPARGRRTLVRHSITEALVDC